MLSSRVRLAIAAAAGWAVIMSGCATGAKAQSGRSVAVGRSSARSPAPSRAIDTINDICPISGRPVQPNGPVALYQGLEVGFCSRKCVRPWITLSDGDKRKLIAKVASDARMRNWGPLPRNPFR